MAQEEGERVEHPKHYNSHPSGVECIEVAEWFQFCIGNAIKYLWRAGLKPGVDTIEDLKKAAWYIQREIERIEKANSLEDGPTRKDRARLQNSIISMARREADRLHVDYCHSGGLVDSWTDCRKPPCPGNRAIIEAVEGY